MPRAERGFFKEHLILGRKPRSMDSVVKTLDSSLTISVHDETACIRALYGLNHGHAYTTLLFCCFLAVYHFSFTMRNQQSNIKSRLLHC